MTRAGRIGRRRTVARLCWVGWTVALALIVSPVALGQTRLLRVLALDATLPGTEEHDIRWPVAVATSEGQIAVADAHGPRLLLFAGSGTTWQVERVVELPATPVGLAHDGTRFVASLRGNGGLVAFEGPQLLQRRLVMPREVVPGALAGLPGGGLIVYDFAGERLIELDERGALVRERLIGGTVTGLTSASSGAAFAVVGASGDLLRFDAAGEQNAAWKLPEDDAVPAWPVGIAVDAGGDLYVADRHTDRILVLDAAGKPIGVGARRGSEPGLIRFPSAIAMLPDGRPVVADQGNGRVQIFRRTRGGAGQ